jgi:hypothetical protein
VATEFNYVVNVDTTRVMGAMSEVRSQMGMALGGPGGFGAGPAMSRMMASLETGLVGGFGRTHTDPEMSYTPHYGQVHATTSMAQEQAVQRFGLAAAQAMRPPGVSAYEYAMGVHGNAIERQQEARHSAKIAAQSAFFSGVGGLAGGELAFMAAAPVGRALGGRVATRLFGAGAAGAGRMLGGLGLGIAAFGMAEEAIGGRIRQHFADVEQIGGVTRELGDIVGGGRGLTRRQQYETGVAAREAAKDINMDVQQMGDVASLARGAGLLPSTTDPKKLRQQLGELASAVDEGASVLHTSLANATMVLRSAAKQGISGEEAILRAGAAGGAEAYLAQQARYQAFGAAGGQFALQNRLSQRQGFQLFTGALGQAAGAGISGDAMQVLGGRYGAAQLIGAGQIGAAMSPLGNLQLMAAAGGQGLGGLLELPGQAMEAMGAGGDFLSNIGKFMVHQDELRRGVGSKGIRDMARHQMVAGGELIQEFMPGLSAREAQAFWAQNQYGMDPTQAWAYAGGIHRAPGGGAGAGGGEAYARRLQTYQDMQMYRAAPDRPEMKDASAYSGGYGFGMDWALTGGMGGFMVGGAKGAIVGGAGGLIAQNAKALWNLGSDIFGGGGPGLFASAQEKADYYNLQAADEYDAKMAQIRQSYGAVDINQNVAARVREAPLRRTELNLDAYGAMAAQRYGSFIDIAGIAEVQAGPGTMRYAGKSYDIQQMRKVADMLDEPAQVTQKAKDLAFEAVVVNRTEQTERARTDFRLSWEKLVKNDFQPPGADKMTDDVRAEKIRTMRQQEINKLNQSARVLIDASGDPAAKESFARSGIADKYLRGYLQFAAGGSEWEMKPLRAGLMRDVSLTVGLSEAEAQMQRRAVNFTQKAWGEWGVARRGAEGAIPGPGLSDELFQPVTSEAELRQEWESLNPMGPEYTAAPMPGPGYKSMRGAGNYDTTFTQFRKMFPEGYHYAMQQEMIKDPARFIEAHGMEAAKFLPGWEAAQEKLARDPRYATGERTEETLMAEIAGRFKTAAPSARTSMLEASIDPEKEYLRTLFLRRDFRVALAEDKMPEVKRIMKEHNIDHTDVRSDRVFEALTTKAVAPIDVDGHPLKDFFKTEQAATLGITREEALAGIHGERWKEAVTPVTAMQFSSG